MKDYISKYDAYKLLKKHNKEVFHFLHFLTVEGVMKLYANKLG